MNEYQQALQHRSNQNYEKALEIYQDHIKKSQTYDFIREYAHTLCEFGKFEKSIAQYELALSLYPPIDELKTTSEKNDLANTYIGLARAYCQMKNFEESHL